MLPPDAKRRPAAEPDGAPRVTDEATALSVVPSATSRPDGDDQTGGDSGAGASWIAEQMRRHGAATFGEMLEMVRRGEVNRDGTPAR